MDNVTFVKSQKVSLQARQKMLAAMEKYGDNHWWEDDADPRAFAYYQLHEKVILRYFTLGEFIQAVELLVGRPIIPHELVSDALAQEAERAWKYQVGCTSDKERSERLLQGLEFTMKKLGDSVTVVDLRRPVKPPERRK